MIKGRPRTARPSHTVEIADFCNKIGPKADIVSRPRHVGFVPDTGR